MWGSAGIKAAVHNGLEPRIRYSEVHATKTLWICRCAWTTLPRRPQLHRANISKHCLMKRKRELRLGRSASEATGARAITWRSTSRARSPMRQSGFRSTITGHIIRAQPWQSHPSCEVCGTKMHPMASSPRILIDTRTHRSPKLCKSPIAVHRRCACSGVKALRNTSPAKRQAAKLC